MATVQLRLLSVGSLVSLFGFLVSQSLDTMAKNETKNITLSGI